MMKERIEKKRNLAELLKGGVIMDVTNPEQARIAEAAGAIIVDNKIKISSTNSR